MPEDPVRVGRTAGPQSELARVRTARYAEAQLDAVAHQVTQHGPDRPQFVELVEDQPDDMLDLLVGIQLQPVAAGERT